MSGSTQRRTRRRVSNRLDRRLGTQASDPIRPARVLAARALIASGHYERPEVKAFLIEVLLRELRRH